MHTLMLDLQVRENIHLTVEGPPVRRTWRERLRSKPWVAMKPGPRIPDPQVYRAGPYVIGHPETIKKMKAKLL